MFDAHNFEAQGGNEAMTQGIYIDECLLERLAVIGKKSALSVSALLNEIVATYLETNDPLFKQCEEKRNFKRRKIILPAMIFEKSTTDMVGRYYSATILDLSLGGVRLSFPLHRNGKTEIINKGAEFEVIFSMDDDSDPMYFRCSLNRIHKSGHSIQLGAAFCETDPQSHERLQKNL